MEERQLHLELKASMTNLHQKVTDMYSKLESSFLFKGMCQCVHLRYQQVFWDQICWLQAHYVGLSKNEDYISGVAVIQNIQRIVDDNERLKVELAQKTETIDNLRDKIARLHEKNEK